MRFLLVALLCALSYAQTGSGQTSCTVDELKSHYQHLLKDFADVKCPLQMNISTGAWPSQQFFNEMARLFLADLLGFDVVAYKYDDVNLNLNLSYQYIAQGIIDLNFEMWFPPDNLPPTHERKKWIEQVEVIQENGQRGMQSFFVPYYLAEEYPRIMTSLTAILDYHDLLAKLIADSSDFDGTYNRTFNIMFGHPEYFVQFRGPQVIDYFDIPAKMVSETSDEALSSIVIEWIRQGKHFIFYWYEPMYDFEDTVRPIQIGIYNWWPSSEPLLKLASLHAYSDSTIMTFFTNMNLTNNETSRAMKHYLNCEQTRIREDQNCLKDTACITLRSQEHILRRWLGLSETEKIDDETALCGDQCIVMFTFGGVLLFVMCCFFYSRSERKKRLITRLSTYLKDSGFTGTTTISRAASSHNSSLYDTFPSKSKQQYAKKEIELTIRGKDPFSSDVYLSFRNFIPTIPFPNDLPAHSRLSSNDNKVWFIDQKDSSDLPPVAEFESCTGLHDQERRKIPKESTLESAYMHSNWEVEDIFHSSDNESMIDDTPTLTYYCSSNSEMKKEISFNRWIYDANISLDIEAHSIGHGNFASILLGEYIHSTVAFKHLKGENLESYTKEGDLFFEISDHPSICRFFGIYKSDRLKTNFLVMEYWKDGSLESHKHTFDVEQKLLFMKQISSGVLHLRHKNVIHADLGARNILVDVQNNQCCITDFGLSSQHPAEPLDIFAPRWTPGEVIRSRIPTFASDCWSLGCVFLEIMTEKVPFASLTREVLVSELIAGTLNPEIDESWPEDLQKCLRGIFQPEEKRFDIQTIVDIICESYMAHTSNATEKAVSL